MDSAQREVLIQTYADGAAKLRAAWRNRRSNGTEVWDRDLSARSLAAGDDG